MEKTRFGCFGGLEPSRRLQAVTYGGTVHFRRAIRVYVTDQPKRTGVAPSPEKGWRWRRYRLLAPWSGASSSRRLFAPKSLVRSKGPRVGSSVSRRFRLMRSPWVSLFAGRAVEAISQVGRRLEQWNLEPEPTMSAYNLYGLVPGEARLFANAILLRLTDAFVSGERDIKLAVVRAFMGLSKCERKRRRRNRGSKIKDGILSKRRVSNFPELLRRVKAVFDSGDVDSRAMALVLFGCWADFAKDSAHVRYLLLSSLVSSDVPVVSSVYSRFLPLDCWVIFVENKHKLW